MLKKVPLIADTFIGSDLFENLYYIKNNALFKKGKTVFNYSNFQYGEITSVDISNPLKIVVFYKNFNTVVLLDNQLNTVETILFNANIAFVRKSSNHKLLVYNSDSRKIETYNYKTKTTTSSSQPLTSIIVKEMKSDLNSVYILTNKGIDTYDYLGNFANHYTDSKIEQLQINKNYYYTISKNKIFQIKEEKKFLKMKINPKIKNFYVSNSNLYIFNGTQLFHFLIDKND